MGENILLKAQSKLRISSVAEGQVGGEKTGRTETKSGLKDV